MFQFMKLLQDGEHRGVTWFPSSFFGEFDRYVTLHVLYGYVTDLINLLFDILGAYIKLI